MASLDLFPRLLDVDLASPSALQVLRLSSNDYDYLGKTKGTEPSTRITPGAKPQVPVERTVQEEYPEIFQRRPRESTGGINPGKEPCRIIHGHNPQAQSTGTIQGYNPQAQSRVTIHRHNPGLQSTGNSTGNSTGTAQREKSEDNTL